MIKAHEGKEMKLCHRTFCYRAGFIEAWGRGIEKIKDSCVEAGNPMPEYVVKKEDIMVMFKSLIRILDMYAVFPIQKCDEEEVKNCRRALY